jgi:putative aldouronate transport system substrate-binding protein
MIEEYTNTKLDIRPYPNETLQQIYPAMLASGEYPDVMSFGITQMDKSYIINAMQSGMFWDVGPYLSQYPNLSKTNPAVYENYKMDGAIYGVPKVRAVANDGFHYRKDWADAKGLKEPTTIDELFTFLKAFTTKDTYGLTRAGSVIPLAEYFGAPNNWAVKDGKFIKSESTDEFMESLKFEKKLFDEKIIHPEYAIMDRTLAVGLFTNGKAGVYKRTTAGDGLEATLNKTEPNAKVGTFSVLEGPKGKTTWGATGHNGLLVISKKTIKTEKDLKRVLAFLDKCFEPKMANLFAYGIENKHYKVENGIAVQIKEMSTDYQEKILQPYGSTLALNAHQFAMPAKLDPAVVLERKLNAENEKNAIYDPSLGLASETFSTRGTDLEKILADASVKFVMGAINEEQYKNEVKKWQTSGGNKMAEEFAASYAKNRKK